MPKNISPVAKKSHRANFHDYQAKGYYHITATVIDPSVKLSSMPKVDVDRLKNTSMIIPEHSELGEQILAEIKAIPISPAIHPIEREILNMALDFGRSFIKITDKIFGERYKPSGKEFDLCAEGKLLLLSPYKEKQNSGYKEFHNMNDMALTIANLPATCRCAIVSFFEK